MVCQLLFRSVLMSLYAFFFPKRPILLSYVIWKRDLDWVKKKPRTSHQFNGQTFGQSGSIHDLTKNGSCFMPKLEVWPVPCLIDWIGQLGPVSKTLLQNSPKHYEFTRKKDHWDFLNHNVWNMNELKFKHLIPLYTWEIFCQETSTSQPELWSSH